MDKKSPGLGTKIFRVVLIILLVLILLIVTVFGAAYLYYRSKIGLLQPDETRPSEDRILDASQEQELNDQSQDLNAAMNDLLAGMETQDPVLPESKPTEPEDDHVINILLIGTDDAGNGFRTDARGDTCMLFSINTAGDHPVVSLVSFERGMGVPILEGQYEGQWDWLTHSFFYGGAELMLKEIQYCFNLDVDYYVRVNFHSFIAGINAIGGVDVYLDSEEANYLINGAKFDVSVGMNHLTGYQALAYARLREIDSDWQRIERQREVIASALNQLRQLDLADADALINELLGLVRTNMDEKIITELLLLLPSLPQATVQQMTIPQAGTYGGMIGMGGRGLFAADFEVNSQILHEFLYGTDE